jgi:hypothetical protein
MDRRVPGAAVTTAVAAAASAAQGHAVPAALQLEWFDLQKKALPMLNEGICAVDAADKGAARPVTPSCPDTAAHIAACFSPAAAAFACKVCSRPSQTSSQTLNSPHIHLGLSEFAAPVDSCAGLAAAAAAAAAPPCRSAPLG